MVTLEKVEIPGLREAIKREARVRDTAYLDGHEIVCGVEVVPLCLRRLIWLEQAHNGFVVPWKFENDGEKFAHAISFLYFLRPDFSPPISPRETFWQSFKSGLNEQVFINRYRNVNRDEFLAELLEWISDYFMDAPNSGGSEIMPPSYASYPTHIIDLFAQANLPFLFSEIMDMPLKRLWQHYRIASRRVNEIKLTNPSDEISVRHISNVKS